MWRGYSSLLSTDGVRLQREHCTGVQEHAKDHGLYRSQISGPSSTGNICSQDLGVWETVEECARVHDVATLYNALHSVASYRLDKPETLKFNFKDAPYLTDEPLKALLLSKPAGKETYLQALHFIRGPLLREGPPPTAPKGQQQGSGGGRGQCRGMGSRSRQRPKHSGRVLKGGTWTVEGRTWRKRLTENDIKVHRVLIKPQVLEVLFGYKTTSPAEEGHDASADPLAVNAAAAAAAAAGDAAPGAGGTEAEAAAGVEAEAAAEAGVAVAGAAAEAGVAVAGAGAAAAAAAAAGVVGAGESSRELQPGDTLELARGGESPSSSERPGSSDPSWTASREGQEKGGGKGKGNWGTYKEWRALPEPVLASYCAAEGDPRPQLWLLRFNSAGKDGFMLQPKTVQHLLSELGLEEGDALVLEATSDNPLKPTANLSFERAAAAATGQKVFSGGLTQAREGEQQWQQQGIEREGGGEEAWEPEFGGEEEEEEEGEGLDEEGEEEEEEEEEEEGEGLDEEGEEEEGHAIEEGLGMPRQQGLVDGAWPGPGVPAGPSLGGPSPLLICSQPVIPSAPRSGSKGRGNEVGGTGPNGIPSKRVPAFPVHQRPQQLAEVGAPPPSKRARGAAAAADRAEIIRRQQQEEEQQQEQRLEAKAAEPQPQATSELGVPVPASGAAQPHRAAVPAASLQGPASSGWGPREKRGGGGALALARRIIKRASKAALAAGQGASGGAGGSALAAAAAAAAGSAGLPQCALPANAPPPLQQAPTSAGDGGLGSPELQLPAGDAPLTPNANLEG